MVWKRLARLSASPLFGKYLLATNTISSGVLMAAGDVLIQKIEHVRQSTEPTEIYQHNWARTGRMFAIGLIQGPISHVWYLSLDKFLIGTSTKTVVKKILLDQIIASPTFAFIFFMGMGTMEGKTVNSSYKEFRRNFWEVYKMDWTVWPAAQAINFYFLPTQYRVLYTALVTLGWDTYLSFVKHKDNPMPTNHTKESNMVNPATDPVTMVTNKVSMVTECGSTPS